MQCTREASSLPPLQFFAENEQLCNLFPCKAMTMSKERLHQKEMIKSVSNSNNNNNSNLKKPPYRVNALSKITKKSIPHYLKPTATSSSYVSSSSTPLNLKTPQKQIFDSKLTTKTSSQPTLPHSKIQKQTSNCSSSTRISSRAAAASSSHSRTQNGSSLSTKTTSFLHSKIQKQTFDSSTPSQHKNSHMPKVNNWSTVRNSYHTVTKLSEAPPKKTTTRAKSIQKQAFNGFSRSRTTPASKAQPVCILPQRPSSADSTKVRTRSINPSISSLLSPIKAQSIIRRNSKSYGSSMRMSITSSTPMILTVIHEEEEEEEEVDDKESKGELEERVKCWRELADEEVEMLDHIEHLKSYSGPFDIRRHKIEQTTNKFSIGRPNKVKALAGAFETAISSQKFESRSNNHEFMEEQRKKR